MSVRTKESLEKLFAECRERQAAKKTKKKQRKACTSFQKTIAQYFSNKHVMKRISFDELSFLVRNVDPIFLSSFPFHFAVKYPTESLMEYKVGLMNISHDDDETPFIGVSFQYLEQDGVIIDIESDDEMQYDDIDKMLKKKCRLGENCEIYLVNNKENFTGMLATANLYGGSKYNDDDDVLIMADCKQYIIDFKEYYESLSEDDEEKV